MKKILDYEEMQDLLSSLDKDIIVKEDPIGFTNFGMPIDHYSYGHGDYHLIITGGTHSSELITNIFVIRFMEKLSNKEIFIDPNVYTIDFIPFVNPEGTVIVTSAIRSLIKRNISSDAEQTYLLTFYRNSRIEGIYYDKDENHDIKLEQWMFRYATPECIDDKYLELKNYLRGLFKENDLPRGCMINWSSNGRGVDLNSNLKESSFIERVKSGEKIYAHNHLSNIRRDKLGPLGCPYYDRPGEVERENKALLEFYEKINKEHKLIGSMIYHSCGDIVTYLDDLTLKNPFVDNYSEDNTMANRKIALKYADVTGYKLDPKEIYTTVDSYIKTFYPVTLLIELGSVTATPLSQFMDLDIPGSGEGFKHVYPKIIESNTKAILDVLPLMVLNYDERS